MNDKNKQNNAANVFKNANTPLKKPGKNASKKQKQSYRKQRVIEGMNKENNKSHYWGCLIAILVFFIGGSLESVSPWLGGILVCGAIFYALFAMF